MIHKLMGERSMAEQGFTVLVFLSKPNRVQ